MQILENTINWIFFFLFFLVNEGKLRLWAIGLEIPWTEEPGGLVHGVPKRQTRQSIVCIG